MKRFTSSEALKKAEELALAIDQRKSAEKAEAQLKEWFKTHMAEEKTAIAGHWLFLMTERSRRDLNKDALKSYLGDKYFTFEEEKKYTIFEMKSI